MDRARLRAASLANELQRLVGGSQAHRRRNPEPEWCGWIAAEASFVELSEPLPFRHTETSIARCRGVRGCPMSAMSEPKRLF
jgi:hypothetical protein